MLESILTRPTLLMLAITVLWLQSFGARAEESASVKVLPWVIHAKKLPPKARKAMPDFLAEQLGDDVVATDKALEKKLARLAKRCPPEKLADCVVKAAKGTSAIRFPNCKICSSPKGDKSESVRPIKRFSTAWVVSPWRAK